MVNHLTMKMVNIYEAKARLSQYLEAAAHGERVLICKRNEPVAELRRVEAARTDPRPVGLAKGRLDVPAAFFEPLPEEVMESFYGLGAHGRRSTVAEPRGKSGGGGSPKTRRRR